MLAGTQPSDAVSRTSKLTVKRRGLRPVVSSRSPALRRAPAVTSESRAVRAVHREVALGISPEDHRVKFSAAHDTRVVVRERVTLTNEAVLHLLIMPNGPLPARARGPTTACGRSLDRGGSSSLTSPGERRRRRHRPSPTSVAEARRPATRDTRFPRGEVGRAAVVVAWERIVPTSPL